MNDSFKTMLAFVGGAIAGAAIGILLAPDKGSETRKKMMNRAKDLADDVTEAAKEKYEQLLSRKDGIINDIDEKLNKNKNVHA